MNIRINWGVKVTVLYATFVVMIVCLVAATFRHKSDLVSEDYYQQELLYQRHLSAVQAANSLPKPVQVLHRDGVITLKFPELFQSTTIVGSLRCYCAANAAQDRTFAFQTGDGSWHFSSTALKATRYQLQVNWVAAGKEYYQEVPVDLTKQ